MDVLHKQLDTERLDYLEELFSITADDSRTWKDFMTLVHERGFRAAIDLHKQNQES